MQRKKYIYKQQRGHTQQIAAYYIEQMCKRYWLNQSNLIEVIKIENNSQMRLGMITTQKMSK